MGKPENDPQPKNAMIVGREGLVLIDLPFEYPRTELPNTNNWTPTKPKGGNGGESHRNGSKRLEKE